MKISVDDQEIFRLSETQKKVIKNDIPEEIFDTDMKRRIHYIVNHKYEKCLERLKNEWMPKLKNRTASVPTNDEQFAELVFSQNDYKNRSQIELERNIAKE